MQELWLDTPDRFAIGRFGDDNGTFVGVIAPRGVIAVADLVGRLSVSPDATVPALLADLPRLLPLLDEVVDDPDTVWRDLADVVILAPVDPETDVVQVFHSGANYREHVINLALAHYDLAEGETKEAARTKLATMMDERAASGTPYIFLGTASKITGPGDDVELPTYGGKADWELELVAVIGRPGFRIPVDEALEHVAAYTIGNDLTLRDQVFRQDMPDLGTDWFRSKNAPGFLPLGPWLVPAAHVDDVNKLQLRLALNGETKQDESTADMLFDVARLVSEISHVCHVRPGDLVLTGSPAGNGMATGRLLRDGDVMTSTISGLGTQHTRVVAAAAGADATDRS